MIWERGKGGKAFFNIYSESRYRFYVYVDVVTFFVGIANKFKIAFPVFPLSQNKATLGELFGKVAKVAFPVFPKL